MKGTFTIGLALAGGFVGFIVAVLLDSYGLLPKDINSRWLNLAFALVGGFIGWQIDNKRELARIARELEQDQIRMEQESRAQKEKTNL